MADDQQSRLAKITGMLAALVAAAAVTKVVNMAWESASGHKPPRADDEDAGLSEVVVAAALTGALVAAARILATRGTAKFAARVNSNRS